MAHPVTARAIAGGKTACPDVILVGGGLANMLIALRLKARRPELSLLVLEAGAVIGGNHTWSFHETDVSATQLAWLKPLIGARWPDQIVRFPAYTRRLATPYASIFSHRLAAHAETVLGPSIRTRAVAVDVTPTSVTLLGGEVLQAPCVIDGRGPMKDAPLAAGLQKFVGLEIECEVPHGEHSPVIMDASVEQLDGYRFVYTLPFTPTRLLIEDTYYSDTADLDVPLLENRIASYAAARAWRIGSIVRREAGVLPITLTGNIDEHWKALGSELPRSGLRAWLFHSTTGYSLPFAARAADAIAAGREMTSAPVAALLERQSREAWRSQTFFRLLNRMLFLAAAPKARVDVLQRFYTLPQPLIERFYGARLTAADYARLMTGKPPIPITDALRSIVTFPAHPAAAGPASGSR